MDSRRESHDTQMPLVSPWSQTEYKGLISKERPRGLSRLALPVSICFNVVVFALLLWGSGSAREHPEYARTVGLSTSWSRFQWHTEYSMPNHSRSDELWDAILPSHGFVAMDREWAADQHWPTSMYLPGDKSKGVYLLEAYHQLHCLRIIRTSFWESVEGKPFTYGNTAHVDHCFDALRQATICNADATPLYTFGDKTAGINQMHKCRDWEELRRFAFANTACYRDSIQDIPLGEHFGHCGDGDDGVRSL